MQPGGTGGTVREGAFGIYKRDVRAARYATPRCLIGVTDRRVYLSIQSMYIITERVPRAIMEDGLRLGELTS
jgi:hypothetical protein